jgi:hypothetical protein
MIPDSLVSRLNPAAERQTISISPTEFQVLKTDDAIVTHGYRMVVMDIEELRHSGSLPCYHATFSSTREP